MPKIFYYSWIFAIISDLYIKYIASFSSITWKKIHLIWDYVYLTYIKNDGIAFSIWLTWVLLKTITIALISWLLFYYFKYENKKSILTNLWYWLLIWWAIWNGIERIFYWEVIDFVWVKYFAVFNLADAYITIWIILLIYYNLVCQKYFDQKK